MIVTTMKMVMMVILSAVKMVLMELGWNQLVVEVVMMRVM